MAQMAPSPGCAGPVEFTLASVSLLTGFKTHAATATWENQTDLDGARALSAHSPATFGGSLYALKDDPQPQVREARGLSKRNPAPCRPST